MKRFAMLFVNEHRTIDNRVGRFGVILFLIVLVYFLIGIVIDVASFLE
ncbi:MAG: hypothetical protein IPL87_01565 [Candidatus Moraniibacteriota bacterium]|nr:MAG: hypothetical protein IPL87_01565 [Candidatus Moranbacteria bacterium]